MPGSEPPRELERIAVAFANACERAAVAYAFMGGLAVVAWGQPRTTSDVDVMVRLTADRVAPLSKALRDEGLDVEEVDLAASLRDRSHVTVFTGDPGLHVDLKVAFSHDEARQIAEAAIVPLEGGRIRIVRPEDTVAYKVKFGSDRDLEDAAGIIARQGKRLDRERLRRIASRIGVTDAVEDLLREVHEAVPD